MKKTRSGYTKRRYYCNQFFKRRRVLEENMVDEVNEGDEQGHTTTEHSDRSPSAKKIKVDASKSKPNKEKEKASGVRFIDAGILSEIFHTLPYKNCRQCHLELLEDPTKGKGCVSCLILHCSSCGWENEFYTSRRIGCFFDVNRTFICAMRSVGCGSLLGQRFCGIMNMPSPPRVTPYSSHNKLLRKAVKDVCSEIMADTAKEVHDLKGKGSDDIIDCGISCDGTWELSGFLSLNGCVTAISMNAGKVLDIETFNEVCKAWFPLNRKNRKNRVVAVVATLAI